MEALREVVQINNSQLNLTLPVNFNSKYVEIIILPYDKICEKKEKNSKTKRLTDFQKFLLSAPVMTDEDYNYYLEKKQNFGMFHKLFTF